MARYPEGPQRALDGDKLLGEAGAKLVPSSTGRVRSAGRGPAGPRPRPRDRLRHHQGRGRPRRLDDQAPGGRTVSLGATFGREVLPYLQELATASIAWWKANRQLVASGIKSFVAGSSRPSCRSGPPSWVSDNLRLIGIVFASVLLPVLVANAAALGGSGGLTCSSAQRRSLRASRQRLRGSPPTGRSCCCSARRLGGSAGPEDVYQFLTGGVSVTAVLVEKVKAFISDFMSGETDDPWWVKALRLALGIHPARLPVLGLRGRADRGGPVLPGQQTGAYHQAKPSGSTSGSPPPRPPPPPIRELPPLGQPSRQGLRSRSPRGRCGSGRRHHGQARQRPDQQHHHDPPDSG